MRHATNTHGSSSLPVLAAAGLGMLAMYLLDPDAGRRRRAVALDKVRSTRAQMEHMADVARRDTVNRSLGLFAGLRSRMSGQHRPTPQKLIERVRARLGRAVSNPHAIRVSASEDCTVLLQGPVLAADVDRLIRAVSAVPGVKHVENHLEVHDTAGNTSALQGLQDTRQHMQALHDWPPATRVAAAAAGITAFLLSLPRGRMLGLAGALTGGALLARSVMNQPLREIAGMQGAHSVHLDKELHIAAPPEQVFQFWCRQEDFPQFMRNVEEVQSTGEDRWHWKVAGPFRPVEWDSVIVEREDNRRLAWRTIPGGAIDSEGRIDFEPEGQGTRLRIRMDYTPTAGAVGHLFARLIGRDAKTEMDEDLMRVKSFLETGTPARDAAATRAAQAEAQRVH